MVSDQNPPVILFDRYQGGLHQRVGTNPRKRRGHKQQERQEKQEREDLGLFGSLDELGTEPAQRTLEKAAIAGDNPATAKAGVAKKTRGKYNRHYWTPSKYVEMKKCVDAFSGKFKTMCSIIFERDAHKDPLEVERSLGCLRGWVKRVIKNDGDSRNDGAIMVLEYGEAGKEEFGRQSSITPHYHILIESVFLPSMVESLKNLVADSCFNNFKCEPIRDLDAAKDYVAKPVKKVVGKKDIQCKAAMNPKWVGIALSPTYTYNVKNRLKMWRVGYGRDLIGLISNREDYKNYFFKKMVVKKGVVVDGYATTYIEGIDWNEYSRLEKIIMGRNLLQNILKRDDGGTWEEWRSSFMVVIGDPLDELLLSGMTGHLKQGDIDLWYWDSLRGLDERDRPKLFDNAVKLIYFWKVWVEVVRYAWREDATFVEFTQRVKPPRF